MDITAILDAAKKAGYEVVPKKDFEGLQSHVNTLKALRESIPEEFRGREADFIKEAQGAFQRVKEYEDKTKTETERLQSEIAAIKGQHTKATNKVQELEQALGTTKKRLKEALIWGHIGKVMNSRNVQVHDKIIETASAKKIEEFDLDQYGTDSEDNIKRLHDAIFKEIIAPAATLQAEIVGQVGRIPASATKGQQAPQTTSTTPEDKTSQFVMWGSKA